jgi:hypothetical protein
LKKQELLNNRNESEEKDETFCIGKDLLKGKNTHGERRIEGKGKGDIGGKLNHGNMSLGKIKITQKPNGKEIQIQLIEKPQKERQQRPYFKN